VVVDAELRIFFSNPLEMTPVALWVRKAMRIPRPSHRIARIGLDDGIGLRLACAEKGKPLLAILREIASRILLIDRAVEHAGRAGEAPSLQAAVWQIETGVERGVENMTFGKDPRTYDMAARILNEEIEHEAWLIDLLSFERDKKGIPSGHFRRGEPGHAPYSKNHGFHNP
jgi:hypothetical protein